MQASITWLVILLCAVGFWGGKKDDKKDDKGDKKNWDDDDEIFGETCTASHVHSPSNVVGYCSLEEGHRGHHVRLICRYRF